MGTAEGKISNKCAQGTHTHTPPVDGDVQSLEEELFTFAPTLGFHNFLLLMLMQRQHSAKCTSWIVYSHAHQQNS